MAPVYMAELPPVPDPDRTPTQKAIDRELHVTVGSALARLPATQRLAIVLRYYEELAYSEMAEALGTSDKAVERLLARARKSLAALLTPS
jgi:RNA polymerase sigma-70 factor (ECF subfamily)